MKGYAFLAINLMFQQMKKVLESWKGERALGAAELQFHVTGIREQDWVVNLAERSVQPGSSDSVDATLTIRGDHLAQVFSGQLDPQVAFVQGKLRVDGDVEKAIEFGTLLPEIQA